MVETEYRSSVSRASPTGLDIQAKPSIREGWQTGSTPFAETELSILFHGRGSSFRTGIVQQADAFE
jgi:hypothetical protein